MTTGRINQVAIQTTKSPRGSNAPGNPPPRAQHQVWSELPTRQGARALLVSRCSKPESAPSHASRPGPVSRPPRREGRVPGRFDPQSTGSERTRGGCRRGRRCGEGSGERARPPKGFPLRSGLGCAPRRPPMRPRSPGCAPPKRGVAYFRSFGFTGGTQPRPVTASARSHRVPSPSDLNVTPRPPPRFASRRSPGLPGGELSKGTGNASEGNGADLAELDATR